MNNTYLQVSRRKCPPCGPFVVDKETNDALCLRCAKPRGKHRNKYNAERMKLDGYNYDSRFEGNYAAELGQLEKAKAIVKWERQVPIAIYINEVNIITSKVDFLVYHHDGSKELVETKGREDERYKLFRKLLTVVWLPLHPEYRYTVVKEENRSWRNFKPKAKV